MQRITPNEGLSLLKTADLNTLKELAQEIRNEKNPSKQVTFVLDSNPNYTNICNVDCKFCAFYRHKGAKDVYMKSIEQVMEHFEIAQKAGLTTVLLQGGVNPDLTIDYYANLIKTAKKRYPTIHPHCFSAVEIWQCAKSSNLSTRQVLEKLWEAGQRTLPGGGAEILSENVRLQISPKKIEEDGWITIHKQAHEIGFKTTATMMYGHVETPEDILTHFETLRNAQDEIAGFTSFVPWSYKRDRTALRRSVKHWAGADHYFRMLAFARIYLDNFDHISASWFGEGKEIGMEALHYGADDFGGTIMEENVHRATEWVNRADHNDMLHMIRKSGFEPAQRDTFYNILRTYEGVDSVEVPLSQRVNEEDNQAPLGIYCKQPCCQN